MGAIHAVTQRPRERLREKIPTLGEVLALGKGKIRFEIDLKGSSLAFLKRLIDEVARFDVLDQVELTSAHVPVLFHIKRINPRLRTGMFFYQLPEWMKPALGQKHILDRMALSNTQVAHLHSSLLEADADRWAGSDRADRAEWGRPRRRCATTLAPVFAKLQL